MRLDWMWRRSKFHDHSGELASAMLKAGPWWWDRASSDLPVPAPGTAPLIAVHEDSREASLWVLSLNHSQFESEWGQHFGPSARFAWSNALAAMNRALPYLATNVATLHTSGTKATKVDACCPPGAEPSVGAPTGQSFGLSFAIAQLSWLMNCAPPADLIASVAISAKGDLLPVGDLHHKLEGILRMTPRVDRVMVHHNQENDAREALADLQVRLHNDGIDVGCVSIQPVKTVPQALELAFDRPLSDLCFPIANDWKTRQELIKVVQSVTVPGQGAYVSWAPVAAFARRALVEWEGDLGGSDDGRAARIDLEDVLMVAERHESNRGELPPSLSRELLDSVQPDSRRLRKLAHYVQQSADATEVEWVLNYADKVLAADQTNWEDPHYRVLGARGRAFFRKGDLGSALEAERTAARYWLLNQVEGARWEISFPVSAWFLMTSLFRDNAEGRKYWNEAQAIWERGARYVVGKRWVELPRLRAALVLEIIGPHEVASQLAALLEEQDFDHLMASIRRWLIVAYRSAGNTAAAIAGLAELENRFEAHPSTQRLTGTVVQLARIDDALSCSDLSRAAAIAAEIIDCDPLAAALVAGVPVENHAAHLALWYPY